MNRRTSSRAGFDYLDPGTAARLDAIGIPGDLAVALAGLEVTLSVVERLHACPLGWDEVRTLVAMPGLRDREDVAALVTLATMGMEFAQIRAWARLGRLDPALRLHLLNVPVATVAAFPLTPERGTESFLRMLQATTNSGIHVDDMLLWHTAGVLTLSPPYLIEARWVPWRSAAVHHLGMRPAALAAAAGLSIEEAVTQWVEGQFDTEGLRMLAALRAGRF